MAHGICCVRGRKEANHKLRIRGIETSILPSTCVLNLESARHGLQKLRGICPVSHWKLSSQMLLLYRLLSDYYFRCSAALQISSLCTTNSSQRDLWFATDVGALACLPLYYDYLRHVTKSARIPFATSCHQKRAYYNDLHLATVSIAHDVTFTRIRISV